MDVTAPTAPPQLSPDGHWWWDGTQWVAVTPPPPPIPVQPTPVPTPAPAPAAAWPTAGTPSYGQPQSGTDGLAVASLVCSLVWVMGLGSVAAVVLGHMSRGKAKREGRPTSGLALAGLILGYLGSVGLVFILAAIAIPVFLNQRTHADVAAVKSDLRNASTAEEAYRVDNGTYSDSLDALQVSPSTGVSLAVLSATETSYCLGARKSSTTYYYSSDGGLSTVSCAS